MSASNLLKPQITVPELRRLPPGAGNKWWHLSLSRFGAAALCASLAVGTAPAFASEEPGDSTPTPVVSDTAEPDVVEQPVVTEPVVEETESTGLEDTESNASEDGNVVVTEETEEDELNTLDVVPAEDAPLSQMEEARPSSIAPLSASTQALSSWNDNFNRTVTNGWGANYSITGSSTAVALVNGQRGQVRVPAGQSSVANAVGFSGRDVNAKVTVRVSAIPTTGYGTFTGLDLRVSDGSYYRATLRLAPKSVAAIKIERVTGSTATLVNDVKLPFAPKANTAYNFEFKATGTSKVELAARAWPVSETTPAWQATTTDSAGSRLSAAGGVAIRSYVHEHGSTLIFGYDDFKVTSTSGSTTTPQPTPKPTATPTAAPVPPATDLQTSIRSSAGSLPVGQAKYAVPSGAVFARAAGNSSGSGTQASPYGSLAKAISAARSGQTIVLRGGTYHESVEVPAGKKLTIQSYPGEAVWLDGAETLSSWQQSGTRWRTKWTYDFENRVSHTRNKHEEWFVNSAYPASRYPEQVWVAGKKLTQVLSLNEVREGTFYVDGKNDWIYIGVNPSGKKVEASTLQQAMTIQGVGTTVRGIGVKRYADHLALMGAVSSQVANVNLENLVISDNSTVGLYGWNPGQVWNKLTVTNNGLLGIGASQADRLKITNSLAAGNNSERFNYKPVAGGIKITRSVDVSVTGTVAERNIDSTGIWFDEWNRGIVAANNVSVDNGQYGIEVEVSDNAVVAGNYLLRNAGAGVYVLGGSNVSLWNNSITAESGRAIYAREDSRKGTRSDVPMDLRNLTVKNNVVNLGTNNCSYLIDDALDKMHWKNLKLQSDGNVYRRNSATSPANVICLAVGAQNLTGMKTHAALTSEGLEKSSVVFDGGAPITSSTGTQTSRATDVQSKVAHAVPSNVAQVLGVSSGTKKIGPIRNP